MAHAMRLLPPQNFVSPHFQRRRRRRSTEIMNIGGGKVVCVTGASGFIASWLVKLLLERGYTVRATVRDLNDPKKTQHLLSLDGAKERLHLFRAELTEEGSFDSAIGGCEGVFHTASPVLLSVSDPQAELLDPAIKGTLNVLKSCAKVSSIKRVVMTSSMAAVIFNGRPLTPDVIVDETWFSDPDFCEKSKIWYMLSKTLAERSAWEFARENGIDLVTLNPGLVIGPILQPTLNLTVNMIFDLINGAETYPNSSYRYVDVRDVATAHVLAYENPKASGRFCLVNKVAHCAEVLAILHNLYPSMHLPNKVGDDNYFGSFVYTVSKEKAKELGLEFTPLEATVRDTVEGLKAKGFFHT